MEEPDYPYIDGACTLLLNTKGTKGNPSQELTKLHSMVSKVKAKKEVNLSYMKSWEWEQIHREEGRAEGHEAGLIEGRAEGIHALIATCKKYNVNDEQIIQELMDNFTLEKKDAEKYLAEYK